MKKDNFLQGAFIATAAIVIAKVLGIIYVVPFNRAVGTLGGALYGYAYSIYTIFLSLSTAGIPFAVSKMVSEYSELGYVKAKQKALRIACFTLGILGILSFLFLVFLAPLIASFIVAGKSGGNTIEDITFVIRVISFSILIVPIMSVYRGYFQGHKYIKATSYSTIIEQVIRVGIIIFISAIAILVPSIKYKQTVSIALIAASLGALISLLYLYYKSIKNKKEFNKKNPEIIEPRISNKKIFYKLWGYAVPFIILNVCKSVYTSIDVFLLPRMLPDMFKYTKENAEIVSSVLSTWGFKLNMIVVSIATGIMTSLVPNIASSLATKNYANIRNKVNQSLEILIFFSIPMTLALAFLVTPVWNIFYRNNTLAINVYTIYIFTIIFNVVFTTTSLIIQTLGHNRVMLKALLIGFLSKLLLHIPLMKAFYSISLPPYIGALLSTMIGFAVCSFICLKFLKKEYQISYRDTYIVLVCVIFASLIMLIAMFVLKLFIPVAVTHKLSAIITVIIYTIVGSLAFFLGIRKTKAFRLILGKDKYLKMKKKFKKIL